MSVGLTVLGGAERLAAGSEWPVDRRRRAFLARGGVFGRERGALTEKLMIWGFGRLERFWGGVASA